MAMRAMDESGYQIDATDEELRRRQQEDAQPDPQAAGPEGPDDVVYQHKGIQPNKEIAPGEGLPQTSEKHAPEPIVQTAPATDTLQPADIANVVTQTQTPEIARDSDPAVIALMRERYGSGAAPADTSGNLADGSTGPLSMEQLLQNRLIELMNRSTVPSATDPDIAATLQATRAAGQRSFDRNAADLAERASYSGQSGSGAAEAGRAALRQAQGDTEQQITAQTFTDAANRRIAELQNTLQLSGNLLDAKQQRALELQIAQLQDATSRYGIGEGGRQFDAGLAEKIREYGLDAAAAAAGMSASAAASAAGLDQRKYEFDKNYGLDERAQTLNESKFTAGQNSDPILAWLMQNYGPRTTQ